MGNFHSPAQAMFRLSRDNSAFLTQLSAGVLGRSLGIAVALAVACNRSVTLPGGDLESPEKYFMEHSGVDMAEAVSVINEITPVDFKTVLDVAKNLYLVRYELAQKPFMAFGSGQVSGIAGIFGLSAHVAPCILETLENDSSAIMRNAERFYEIIKELRKD